MTSFRSYGRLLPVALLLLIGPLLALTGCLSDRMDRPQDFDEAPLFGMVYDFDNEPCAGALIRVDGEDAVRTDINGRFVINDLSRGRHQLEVLKEGYESYTLAFDFLNRSQALYVRMISANQLLRQVEEALEKRRYSAALEMLERVERIEPANPVAAYLRGAYLIRVRRDAEAAAVLEGLVGQGYQEPVLYLTLADLYEYRLSDPERARHYLEQYLRIEADPEVQKRLDALP
jgi:tetratricopeptide (TPR) repeat protein